MEKQIALVAYWLGLISVVLAVLLRGLFALGTWVPNLPVGLAAYGTFYRGGGIFLLLAIASDLRTSRL